MSNDRRYATRKDACLVGSLRVEGRADALECLVWDVSQTGARVEIAADTIVPDRVTLAITAYAPPRRCAVVRREGRRLSVRFDR